MDKQTIRVDDLLLWDENARFPDKYFKKSESELIKYFLEQKNFKIKELAQEIIKDIDLPQLEKLVVIKTGEGNVVLEGNRRLVAYKLLIDPEKANTEELVGYFRKLNVNKVIDKGFALDCIVTENKDDALRYIDRKHMNSNNEVSWGDNERAHHNARRGNAKAKENLKIGIGKIIQGLDIPESLKEQVLGRGFVTTLWRLLVGSSAYDVFGFDIDDSTGDLSVEDEQFSNKLVAIIFDVLSKENYNGKRFSRLSAGEISDYLRNIDAEKIKDAYDKFDKAKKKNLFGEEEVLIGTPKRQSGKKPINPKSTSRKYLIPKTCRLTISEPKINNIYRELKDNLLLDDSNKAVPNATGVLFRVFLESSLDYFYEKRGKAFGKDTKLAGKITEVASILESDKLADKRQLKNIRSVSTNKHSLLSVENFHSYVHDYKAQPASADLKLKWDNLQEFFEILFEDINKNVR